MSRRVRNARIETRTARARLQRRGLPYYVNLEAGLHLGYRRLAGPTGKWVVRMYLGKSSAKKYDMPVIGEADDASDADGISILSYDQAQAKAREMRSRRVTIATGGVEGPYTVRRAIEDYCENLKAKDKDHRGPQVRANALILPALGDIEVAALTTDQLQKWLNDIAKSPARLRTRAGKPQRFRKAATDEASKRQRKSTANRVLTILKAALNRAFKLGRVASNDAIRRVEPFEQVESKRDRYLDLEEASRLINACEPEFRKLVQAALLTGCRFGELTKLTVRDFRRDSGTVHVRWSKGGKDRHVVLTDEGINFFADLCAGRDGNEVLFPSYKMAQHREFVETVKRARISPPITFHGLRHTYASLSIMGGVPLMVLARNLGHADTRMCERHYGHLAPSYIADAIRAGAPTFGIATTSNAKELRRGG